MAGFRLLALDLDGTTVRRDGSVGRQTRRAVQAARRAGVTVCVATGRTYEAADAFAGRLGAEGPVICCDGGLVRERRGGPVCSAWPIDYELAVRVCAAAESLGGGWAAYGDRGRVFGGAVRPTSLWRSVLHLANRPLLAWQRLRLDRVQLSRRGPVEPGERIYKMIIWGEDPVALAEGVRGLPLAFPSGVGRRAIEIVGAGVSKALALASVAEALGIDRHEVVAFGDGPNDLEMLAYAGRGVAMANAPEPVRAVADAITGTVDEEGFARALDGLLAAGLAGHDTTRGA